MYPLNSQLLFSALTCSPVTTYYQPKLSICKSILGPLSLVYFAMAFLVSVINACGPQPATTILSYLPAFCTTLQMTLPTIGRPEDIAKGHLLIVIGSVGISEELSGSKLLPWSCGLSGGCSFSSKPFICVVDLRCMWRLTCGEDTALASSSENHSSFSGDRGVSLQICLKNDLVGTNSAFSQPTQIQPFSCLSPHLILLPSWPILPAIVPKSQT